MKYLMADSFVTYTTSWKKLIQKSNCIFNFLFIYQLLLNYFYFKYISSDSCYSYSTHRVKKWFKLMQDFFFFFFYNFIFIYYRSRNWRLYLLVVDASQIELVKGQLNDLIRHTSECVQETIDVGWISLWKVRWHKATPLRTVCATVYDTWTPWNIEQYNNFFPSISVSPFIFMFKL